MTCGIITCVAASAAKAELGALSSSAKEAKVIQLILTKLCHPQPPTPIHGLDNTKAVDIINNTINWQSFCSMEMMHFWLLNQEA